MFTCMALILSNLFPAQSHGETRQQTKEALLPFFTDSTENLELCATLLAVPFNFHILTSAYNIVVP